MSLGATQNTLKPFRKLKISVMASWVLSCLTTLSLGCSSYDVMTEPDEQALCVNFIQTPLPAGRKSL